MSFPQTQRDQKKGSKPKMPLWIEPVGRDACLTRPRVG